MKKQTRGIIDAIISSSTFGFSPFFSVSLLAMGLGALDVLSYRWGIATLVLLLIAIWTKKSVRLNIAGIVMILTTVTIVVIYQNRQKA